VRAEPARLLPLAALLACAAAWLWPDAIAAGRPAIQPLLGLVMLGMGVTLSPTDFRRIAKRPGAVGIGVGLQLAVMPLLGLVLARALDLSPALAAGVILLGACPGGTASNVVTWLARGDVALSVSLTTASTVLAPLATPALTALYAGARVPVPAAAMLRDIAAIVLLPLAAGVALRALAGARVERVTRALPLLSVAAIAAIIAIVVALNRGQLAAVAAPVALAVVLHNGLGLALGWIGARALGRTEREARTIAIEVGMQNSGLAAALAAAHFPPAAALPGALFSVWHNLSGAALASWWSRRPPRGGPGAV
jgi:BASS family bile acid:Na+ symporter